MTKTCYIEIEVEVECTKYSATRGLRDSLGVPLEPDESAHIDIEYIRYNNRPITLTADDLEQVQQQLDADNLEVDI